MRRSWLLPPFSRVCLNFNHFDIQSRNQDIWPPSKRVTVTPAVCPRSFEFLTTLTFGALRRNHIVPTGFETIAKKKKRKHRNTEGSLSTRDQQFIMNCLDYHRRWKGSASVLASMRWLLCGGKKRDLTSMTVPKKTIHVIVY